MKKTVYILLLLLPCFAVAQDSVSVQQPSASATMPSHTAEYTKAAGDSAYARGDYATAITTYEQVMANDGVAAELYYNLGNAYYKNGETARAVLNYERALLLSPSDDDIRFNLELARSKTVDKVSEEYRIFFMEWLYAIINAMSMASWSIVGIVSFILLLVGLLLLFFSNRVQMRRAAFVLSLAMLCTTVFANLSAWHHYHNLTVGDKAIIMAPSVTAKSTPDNSGTNLFVLHEGRKVTITDDTMNSWKEIELEDGTVGWIPATALEVI